MSNNGASMSVSPRLRSTMKGTLISHPLGGGISGSSVMNGGPAHAAGRPSKASTITTLRMYSPPRRKHMRAERIHKTRNQDNRRVSGLWRDRAVRQMVLLGIPLVIFLGAPEFRGRHDGRGDRTIKLSRRL